MKTVQRIITYDGKIHEDVRAAKHHLDVMYGNIIMPLSHQLYQLNGTTTISKYIDANLDTFELLKTIKSDMKWLEGDDNE